jgi:hypothetical protein
MDLVDIKFGHWAFMGIYSLFHFFPKKIGGFYLKCDTVSVEVATFLKLSQVPLECLFGRLEAEALTRCSIHRVFWDHDLGA